jgi:hypothetical protein
MLVGFKISVGVDAGNNRYAAESPLQVKKADIALLRRALPDSGHLLVSGSRVYEEAP